MILFDIQNFGSSRKNLIVNTQIGITQVVFLFRVYIDKSEPRTSKSEQGSLLPQ